MQDPAHSLEFAAQADQAGRAVEEARHLYQRTLAAWVGDLLTLRRAGLDQPGWASSGDAVLREAA